ncbi:hypothetical protein DPMN_006979 [Dreissena polymorpha]|uniref:Uncharacterized protein n=1 Tax=Dreissena polymorpha TaxID=45954 RepID=A0A9D4MW73_DREPO|nr:hypothetical protein DPMN_006979 [Dreissena polymorpha]
MKNGILHTITSDISYTIRHRRDLLHVWLSELNPIQALTPPLPTTRVSPKRSLLILPTQPITVILLNQLIASHG